MTLAPDIVIDYFKNYDSLYSVWPDLAKFQVYGEKLKVYAEFKKYSYEIGFCYKKWLIKGSGSC